MRAGLLDRLILVIVRAGLLDRLILAAVLGLGLRLEVGSRL